MALSDAFAKTFSAVSGYGTDVARTKLMGAELSLNAELARAQEERARTLFPLQFASGLLGLQASRTQVDMLGDELRMKRELMPMQMEQARWQNKQAKLEAAEWYEGRGMRKAMGIAGLTNVQAEIEGRKAEARLRDAQAAEAQANADIFSDLAKGEKAELFDASEMVDDVLGRAERMLGTPVPQGAKRFYTSRVARALKTGNYGPDEVRDMLATEVGNGVESVLSTQYLANQMMLGGGQLPGMPPTFGIPAPQPGRDPLSVINRQQAGMVEQARLAQGEAAQTARSEDIARIEDIVEGVAEGGRPVRGGAGGEADATLLARRLRDKFGITSLEELRSLPQDRLRAIRRDLEVLGYDRLARLPR